MQQQHLDFRLERGVRFSETIGCTIPREMKKQLIELADIRLTTLTQIFRDALAAEIRRSSMVHDGGNDE